jgi:hypothetical protein
MKENSASPTLNSRLLIVAGLHNNIIEIVGTFEVFMGGEVRQIHLPIVVSVSHGFTPAPALSDQ